MTAQTIAATITALEGAVVSAVPGLRVFPFPPKSAQPPFLFINPVTVEYDLSYGRGFDRMTFEAYVGVAAQVDRAEWSQITVYADGASVKAAVEALGSKYRVTDVTFGEIQLAAGTYMGAVFTIDAAV